MWSVGHVSIFLHGLFFFPVDSKAESWDQDEGEYEGEEERGDDDMNNEDEPDALHDLRELVPASARIEYSEDDLIEIVRNSNILWGPGHPMHFYKLRREGEWMFVASHFLDDHVDCKDNSLLHFLHAVLHLFNSVVHEQTVAARCV